MVSGLGMVDVNTSRIKPGKLIYTLTHVSIACDAYKQDLKKLGASGSAYCSSFIAETTTVTIPTTITQAVTVISTVPLTATATTTITGPAPTGTQIADSECGVAGFDSGAVAAYFFDGSGTLGTFETCSARCKQDAGICLSFAFSSTQCLLYSVNASVSPIQKVFRHRSVVLLTLCSLRDLNVVPTSPFTFNAVNCPAPAPVVCEIPPPTLSLMSFQLL